METVNVLSGLAISQEGASQADEVRKLSNGSINKTAHLKTEVDEDCVQIK